MTDEVKAVEPVVAPVVTPKVADVDIDHDEKGRIVSALKRAQKEAKTYREQLEQLKGQLTETASKYEQLNKEILGSKHKAAFEKIALANKVRPDALSDAWQLAGYSPEGEPDEEKLNALVGELVASRAWLLAPDETPAPAPAKVAKIVGPGPGVAKGATSESLDGKMVVTRDQYFDLEWVQKHGKEMGKASKEGRLVIK